MINDPPYIVVQEDEVELQKDEQSPHTWRQGQDQVLAFEILSKLQCGVDDAGQTKHWKEIRFH